MSESKAIFSVLVNNHAGVLLRVAGLFSRRGFNIDSLVACRTQQEEFSRLTIVATGDEAIFTQLIRQLYKLEDVIKVKQLDNESSTQIELLLVKVKADKQSRNAIIKNIPGFGAKVLDIGGKSITLEMTGQSDILDKFVSHLEQFGILEMARTGLTALQCGDETILDEIQ